MPLLLVLPLVVLAAIALLPLSLVMRYRVGTARRPARGWMIAINLIVIGISTALFLFSSAVTSAWIPRAFPYTVLGLAAGSLLGLLGLAWTRWEASPSALYFTPSRTLTLAVTLLVTARVLFGFWRSWRAWAPASTTARGSPHPTLRDRWPQAASCSGTTLLIGSECVGA